MPRRSNIFARACAATGAMRHTLGNQSKCGLLAATFLAAVFSVPDPALADDSERVEVVALNSPLIVVSSYDEEYVALEEGTPIQGTIEVELDTGAVGRIDGWLAWPSFGYQDDSLGADEDLGEDGIRWGTYPGAGVSQSYEGPGRKKVDTSFQFVAEPSDYESVMVAACNSYADKLSSQGMGDTEIFSSNRWIQVAVRAFVEVEATGPEGKPLTELTFWDSYKKVNVICEGSLEMDVPQGPLTAANLSATVVQAVNTSSACTLELSGSITSREPYEEVEFRYVDGKGQQSDLETVTTNADGTIAFTHSFPVSANTESGKVRMVGASPLFLSNWSNFEVDCVEAVDDFATLLPPKATVLSYVVDKEAFHQGKICPTAITVIGRLDGRGKASGTVTLGADGNQLAEKAFSFVGNENKSFTGKHQFTWLGKPVTKQDINLTMRVYGLKPADNETGNGAAPQAASQAPLQERMERTVSVECRAPAPPVLSLSVRGGETKFHQGYTCPERVVLKGRMKGQDDFDGRAVFVVKQEQSLFESQSQVKEFNFAVTEDENLTLAFEPEVRWSNVPTSGDAPPKQTMDFSVRIVRSGVTVASVERSMELSCEGVNVLGTAISLDPPKAIFLEAHPKADEILHQGRICPARISIRGGFVGHGSASGKAVLRANGVVAAEAPYSIEDGQTETIAGEYDLLWHNVPGPIQSNVSFALRLYDAEGDEIDSMTEAQTFACRDPELARGDADRVDGLVSDETPQPKSYNLVLSQVGSRFRNGYVCPEKVSMDGIVNSGSEGFSGSVSHYTGAVQRHTEAVELGPNLTQAISAEHVLDWENGAFPEKVVVYAFKVENQYGLEVGSKQVTKRMACQKIETNRDPAVSDLFSGGARPVTAQQGGKAAAGQLALQAGPAFAIQAPKGRVRAGRIQLSGGPADARYDLRFYRGDKGGYRMLRSAQLPRQMTGRTATFNLKALSGSRNWRIEVCPAGSNNKRACKTSEFQLPSQRSSSNAAPRANAAGTKVFILPGQGG